MKKFSKITVVDLDVPAKPEEPSPIGDLFPPIVASATAATYRAADVPVALAPEQNRIAGLNLSLVAAEPGRYTESNKAEILNNPATRTIPATIEELPDEGKTITVEYQAGEARRLQLFAVLWVEVTDENPPVPPIE